MFSFQDTVFQIGHVPSASKPNRIESYTRLLERMSPLMADLGSETVFTPEFEAVEAHRGEFPSLRCGRVHYEELHFGSASLLTNGYGGTDFYFPTRAGEVGLLLSLWRGLRRFLASDAQHVLWLEDDTLVTDRFEEVFLTLGRAADFEFDALVLASLDQHRWEYPHLMEEGHDFEFGHEVFCRVWQYGWAGAVLLSRRGAERVLASFVRDGLVLPWDWLLMGVRAPESPVPLFEVYAPKPWVAKMFDLDVEVNRHSTISMNDDRWGAI